MPDELILREKARAVVESGKLPSRRPDRTWGGPGVGAPCTVCERPVTKDELEFEIQFARDSDNFGLDKFHVHFRCFAAWEFERNKTRPEHPRPHIGNAGGRVIASLMSEAEDGELIVKALNNEAQGQPAALKLKHELSELCAWLTEAGFGADLHVRKARQVLISEDVRALDRREIIE